MECARYLETYKALENKPASSIQARLETEFLPRLQNCLTAIRSVVSWFTDNGVKMRKTLKRASRRTRQMLRCFTRISRL